ncbi:MAG: zinc ribbon domain-containing protein [Candidatus Altiarchaeota archaeon]|nr:zinc ribbon domain-containing protein [Candidatus Altiarchaeota archaeon]
MDKKGGAGAGVAVWIVGFFLGLFFILTILGVIIGIIIWVVFFMIGLVLIAAGGKTEVIIQQLPQQSQHTIGLSNQPQIPEPHVIEKVVVRCPYCGTKNDEDSEFCKKCGKSLNPGLKDKKKSSS